MNAEALSKCRYYSGEEDCPFSIDALRHYWDLERLYVAHDGELNKLQDELYTALGGKEFGGIPRALLIEMFTVYGKWLLEEAKKGGVEDAGKLLECLYMKMSTEEAKRMLG